MRTAFSLLALASIAALAVPAAAADFTFTLPPGGGSTDFGNTGFTSGAINDTYTFTIPDGSVNGFVGSIALGPTLDVTLSDVRLDTTPFTQVLSDGIELWTLDTIALGAGTHVISVLGTWGTAGGSYAGTLNYTPADAVVPEPATWAMLGLGFALVGYGARRRQGRLQAA